MKTQLTGLRNKRIYLVLIFCIALFFFLRGISSDFPELTSPDFSNPLLEITAVLVVYILVFVQIFVTWYYYIKKKIRNESRWYLHPGPVLLVCLLTLITFFFTILLLQLLETPVKAIHEATDNPDTPVKVSTPPSYISKEVTAAVFLLFFALIFVIWYYYFRKETGNEIKWYLHLGQVFLVFLVILFFIPSILPQLDVPEETSIPVEVLDPRAPLKSISISDLIVIIMALTSLFIVFFVFVRDVIRSESVNGSSDSIKDTMVSLEQLNWKEQVIRYYMDVSSNLEFLGVNDSSVLTTREFENDAERKKGNEEPVTIRNLRELTRIYEIARFSDHGITKKHVERTRKTSIAINDLLFPNRRNQGKQVEDSRSH